MGGGVALIVVVACAARVVECPWQVSPYETAVVDGVHVGKMVSPSRGVVAVAVAGGHSD